MRARVACDNCGKFDKLRGAGRRLRAPRHGHSRRQPLRGDLRDAVRQVPDYHSDFRLHDAPRRPRRGRLCVFRPDRYPRREGGSVAGRTGGRIRGHGVGQETASRTAKLGSAIFYGLFWTVCSSAGLMMKLLDRQFQQRAGTLPKKRNPRSTSTFAVPRPMPVDVPVITTHCARRPLGNLSSGTH